MTIERIWIGSESESDRLSREIIEGICRPAIDVDNASVIQSAAIVKGGIVMTCIAGFHGDLGGQDGTIVDLSDFGSVRVGEALPWPRLKRDALLAASDAYISREDKGADWRAAWSVYRQSLRDLPIAFPNPLNVIWPEKPAP